MSKKYFDKNILMTYDKEAICDIAEDKCSMMSNSNMELVKITFELEQQLADHNKLFRSGVLISAMELHTKIEGLEQELTEKSEALEDFILTESHLSGCNVDTPPSVCDCRDIRYYNHESCIDRAKQILAKYKKESE